MTMLRQLPKILRFVPGAAQDVRAYFLSMQYWLAGSDGNLANLILYLVNRYAAGPREAVLRGTSTPPNRSNIRMSASTIRAPGPKIGTDLTALPRPRWRTERHGSACCSCARMCWPTIRATTTA
jgi:magnesium chelatase subunit H